MSELRYTKQELKRLQDKLAQLKRYLPALQLRKLLLQTEVNKARVQIVDLESAYEKEKDSIGQTAALLTDFHYSDFSTAVHLKDAKVQYENIAGAEIPYLDKVEFSEPVQFFYGKPFWVEEATSLVRGLTESYQRVVVARERLVILERELREVSIRTNLFEKVLIPETESNVNKILVFLGDQELFEISLSKIAKDRKEKRRTNA